jgi:membrane fusion protein (multidrug efflux system)
MRKVLVGFLILAVMILGSCSADRSSAQKPEDDVSAATDYAPLVSSAVQVRTGALRDQVFTSGIVQGRNEAVIRARTSGVIEDIDFELGERVVRNQVLLTLEDRIASLNVSQLRQQYENAKNDLSSSQSLYDRGSLSLSRLTQAKASLDGLEAQLEQAEQALENTRIITPIAGRVAQRSPSLVVGDLIQTGQEIGRVVDLSELRISVSVGQSQLFLVREGYEARIDIPTPYGKISTTGTVTAVSAGSDTRTGSWQVLVDFKNPRSSQVRAGLSAEVTIINRDAPVYTLVPAASLVDREGKTYVFIVESGQARMVEVVLLDRYGNDAAVVSMDPSIELLDYKVLVSGLTRIRDGYDTVIEPYDRD